MTKKRKFDGDGDGVDGASKSSRAGGGSARHHLIRPSYFSYMTLIIFLIASLDSLYFPTPGNKTFEIRRERVCFENGIVNNLTPAEFRKSYRMELASFYKLHYMLKPQLDLEFFPGGGGYRDPDATKYLISTKLRLSIAIRFFAGASYHDLKLLHGVSMSTVYRSVWGVVDAVNKTQGMSFSFPDAEGQRKIANGFLRKSGAKFDKVVGAIDGLLIWMTKPSFAFCRKVNVGEANWRCHRKDKFGFNMQAICDHNLKFTWINMDWPGATSDYMAWVTSDLCRAMEHNDVTKIILPGYTLVGDNAYVKKRYMSVPLKGKQSGYNDAYNFYLSQLRITIERAFGVFVHRWAILRAPLTVPTANIAPLVMCLCRLHNFCIDESQSVLDEIDTDNARNIQFNVALSRIVDGGSGNVIAFDDEHRPTDLLNHGMHFTDVEHNHDYQVLRDCPMDEMLQSVRVQNLRRPRL